ncbi:MAG: adenylate kinase family protein [Phycisphaerales bacterium]
MSDPYKVALLFGAPGVGKGTQGRLIGCIPGFRHIATGDIFRGLDRESDLGRVFTEYSTRGELVPDEFTIQVFEEHLRGLIEAGTYNPETELVVLDGIPRNISQAKILSDDIEVLRVVHLVCNDDEEIVRRLAGRALQQGRADDAKEEVIRRRLDIYRRETRPVLEFFGDELVTEVYAIGTPARVLRDALDVLVPVHEANFSNVLVRR